MIITLTSICFGLGTIVLLFQNWHLHKRIADCEEGLSKIAETCVMLCDSISKINETQAKLKEFIHTVSK